jgi:hypothetical protein
MTEKQSNLLTIDNFSDLTGTTFEVLSDEFEGFSLELRVARALRGDSDAREPFSLIFVGPLEPVLQQSIRRLRHAELGELELFLVPVGPDQENTGIQYEAVFS